MRKANASTEDYSKISYTARGVAYARSLTDIPFSKQIASFCGARQIPHQSKLLYKELSPYFEARYKVISDLLERTKCSNVLELAAGFSPRGLLLTQHSPAHYIEADLPQIVSEKNRLIKSLTGGAAPAGLEISPANVLDQNALLGLISRLPPGPVAVIHEGLLPYLTHTEKRTLALSIREILRRRSGTWITTDIMTIAEIQKTAPTIQLRRAVDKELENTGRDHRANAFTSQPAAHQFFTALGFRTKARRLNELCGPLSVPPGTAPKQFIAQQLSLHAWELTLS